MCLRICRASSSNGLASIPRKAHSLDSATRALGGGGFALSVDSLKLSARDIPNARLVQPSIAYDEPPKLAFDYLNLTRQP
jgi:hypothetical protein